jgi:transcriptional regulator with XRE-family HTH domain
LYQIFDKLLQERGLTAYKVAKGTGIGTGMFSEWKAGKYKPKVDKLQKIADYLGVPLETFLN